MAFFGKKKHDIDEENNLLENESEGFVVHFDEDEDENEQSIFFNGTHKAPHAITIDEVLHSAEQKSAEKPSSPTFTIPMENSNGEYSAAAKNLMSKMMKAKQAVDQAAEKPVEEPSESTIIKEEPEITANFQKVDEILAKVNEAAVIQPAKQIKTVIKSPDSKGLFKSAENLSGTLNCNPGAINASATSSSNTDVTLPFRFFSHDRKYFIIGRTFFRP